MNVRDREREIYSDMWQSVPSYSAVTVSPEHVQMFLDMSGAKSGHILDAGCGTGVGGLHLRDRGFAVTLLDFTPDGLIDESKSLKFREECLWEDLRPVLKKADNIRGTYDYVFCADVIEHIPTEYAMLVIHRLLEASKVGVFMTISTIPDNQGVWAGQALHHTVKPFTWWRDRIRSICQIKECRDLIIKGAFYVAT